MPWTREGERFASESSVFHDLFPKAEADELVMRSTLLGGLEHWLEESGLTQTQAAKALGITQVRVSDVKRGKIGQFSLDMLVRLASRAGEGWFWGAQRGISGRLATGSDLLGAFSRARLVKAPSWMRGYGIVAC